MNNDFDTPARRQALYEKVRAEDAAFDALIQSQIDAQTPPRGHGATGPRTQAGKQKSRLNSFKHGLTGKILLFTAEEKEEFAAYSQGIVESLAPVGALETDLAQTVAENRWRLMRSRANDANLHALAQAPGEPPHADPQQRHLDAGQQQLAAWFQYNKQIQLFALYETRIQRTLDRTMAELRTLRAERLAAQAALDAARAQALEEELLLAEFAAAKGEPYQPTSPKFVFSAQEIQHLLARKKLLEAAQEHREAGKNQRMNRQKAA